MLCPPASLLLPPGLGQARAWCGGIKGCPLELNTTPPAHRGPRLRRALTRTSRRESGFLRTHLFDFDRRYGTSLCLSALQSRARPWTAAPGDRVQVCAHETPATDGAGRAGTAQPRGPVSEPCASLREHPVLAGASLGPEQARSAWKPHLDGGMAWLFTASGPQPRSHATVLAMVRVTTVGTLARPPQHPAGSSSQTLRAALVPPAAGEWRLGGVTRTRRAAKAPEPACCVGPARLCLEALGILDRRLAWHGAPETSKGPGRGGRGTPWMETGQDLSAQWEPGQGRLLLWLLASRLPGSC